MAAEGRQLIFRSDYGVEERRYVVPAPGPHQIVVRVSRSHVSAGSEMNFYRLNPVDGPLEQRPLGYMTVGRVAQIGTGVTAFAVNDRVLTSGNHGSHWIVDLSDDARRHSTGNWLGSRPVESSD